MCKYCEEDSEGYRKMIKGGGGIGWNCMYGWQLELNNRRISILYCPMCGRKLEDE